MDTSVRLREDKGLDIRESWAEYDGTGSRTLEVHVMNGVMEAVITDGKVTRRPLAYHRQVTEPEGSLDPHMGSTCLPVLQLASSLSSQLLS